MLSSQQINKLVKYWHDGAKRKKETMESLYKSKKYVDCLFFGHLILEMALKALVVANTKKTAPPTHNLVFLVDAGNVSLEKEEIDLLSRANEFNIQSRYPEEVIAVYKKWNKSFTDEYYTRILNLYKKLCKIIK